MDNKHRDEIQIFTENIKFLREKHGLSKKEMAKIIGTSVKNLDELEKGKLSAKISVDVLFNAEKYFKIKVSELFCRIK